MKRVLVSVVWVALCASIAAASVSVLFSPHGGCDQALVLLARSAQMYLDAACYTFSLDTVADELIAAQQRGVKVRVILDRSQAHQTWCPASRLAAAGIPVRVNTHSGLMHNKFLVADGKGVATGSFNWTKAAVEENDENLVLFADEVAIASAFAIYFDGLWQDQNRFAAYQPKPAVEPASATSPASPSGYVASKNSEVYHLPSCSSAARIKPSNLISFKTKAEAQATGRRPCKVCRP